MFAVLLSEWSSVISSRELTLVIGLYFSTRTSLTALAIRNWKLLFCFICLRVSVFCVVVFGNFVVVLFLLLFLFCFGGLGFFLWFFFLAGI